jgi:hypothetical protein
MLYIYKKIIFDLNLKQIEQNDNLYNMRFIILSYIHSDFKYIKFKNNNYEIYFMNKKIKKNKFFNKLFEEKNIYITIDKDIDDRKNIFLLSYFYSDYFDNINNYQIYISDLTIFDFLENIKFEKILEIDTYTYFYNLYEKILNDIDVTNISITNIKNIKMRMLFEYYYIDIMNNINL